MILLFFLLMCTAVNDGLRGYWVIWNVGQGQWVTWIETTRCLHFDMGGEKFSQNRISLLCKNKKNSLYLSHWDLDHLNFMSPSTQIFNDFCLVRRPLGSSSIRKERWLKRLPICKVAAQVIEWRDTDKRLSSNNKSTIYLWRKFLHPGDSTKTQESKWITQIPSSQVSWMMLGHHGSRTSTGEKLLNHFNLKMGFVSARMAKYGHPHKEVLERLQAKKIPVLRTEDWGDIRLESDH